MSTKEVFPHPISHFLFKNYHRNSGSVNTELTVAQIIVPFLNFVLGKVHKKLPTYTGIRGLQDLQESHANAYLQYCVNEKANKNKTLEMKENLLSKFYKYLWDEKILKHKSQLKLVSVRTRKEIRKIDEAPEKFDTESVNVAVKEQVSTQIIGSCPVCNDGKMVDRQKFLGCSNYKNGCTFSISKIISGKKLTQKNIKDLLEKKETGKIKGFKSKAGKAFEAILFIKNDKVSFKF